MHCASCGTDNPSSAKFCKGCGASLARTCPGCGALPAADARFCNECGYALGSGSANGPNGPTAGGRPEPAAASEHPAPGAVSERRLVTVLFVDLVGFTTLSQSRDPEDVRELLSRYFETCSALVERYGGLVEKFIGDAVMAVWGAPVAQEDDAERAVRTALDIVDAVASLDADVAAEGLVARAGVLTGEAAVTVGARGQGMVAGDLVNTASRVQSVAEPGTVLVGDATRRATEAAIAYQDAGVHVLKGKDEPLQLHRALRVVAGVGGLMKSEGLEPPFVGRDRELKLVKELFHASTETGRTQLVQVTGIAGIGKSRLVWEFFKYMDGLSSPYLWHRGRCLAYGEGVTYWALAEMVRGRAGILEGEDRASAWAKLRAALDEYVPDPEDRRFVEPRLAQLVGLEGEERAASDRQELFSAWRLFFERLTDRTPVIMVFEDMQWADPSLLEFLGQLLERSRTQPIFVMALTRPETAAAALGATHRNAAFIHLEPLSPDEMHGLLAGFAPGLPDDLTARILERAEGVPLYAVETVRMLLDRGLLVEEGPVYRPTGPIGSLEVPESLHALIAARLDGLAAEERRIAQTASVLGKSFTKHALAALAASDDDALDGTLASLVAKEVFTVHADPRSSERGQYGFVQDLMRTVAYDTLSRHDRRRLHLDAASYLEGAWGADEEEIVEVVASHLLEAWQLDQSATDAPEVRGRAKSMLVRAGDRAASLGAPLEARGYFEQAASLSGDPFERAELTDRSGQMAALGSRYDEAIESFDRATTMFTDAGNDRRAALSQARLAAAEYESDQLDAALERMTAARSTISGSAPDESLATVTAQLGRFLVLVGRVDEAIPLLEEALELAQRLALPEVFAEALTSRALCILRRGRLDEALGLLHLALDVAREHELNATALRASFNLLVILVGLDREAECLEVCQSASVLAGRVGAVGLELELRAARAGHLCSLGRWDDALDTARSVESAGVELSGHARANIASVLPALVARGDLGEARRVVQVAASREASGQIDARLGASLVRAQLLQALGDLGPALERAEEVVAARDVIGITRAVIKRALALAIELSIDRGDAEKARTLLAIIESALPGEVTPWLRAHAARFRARLDVLCDPNADVEGSFTTAEDAFRRLELPPDLAVTLLEHAEWRAAVGGPDAAPLLEEASGIFEQLGAVRWLERTHALVAS